MTRQEHCLKSTYGSVVPPDQLCFYDDEQASLRCVIPESGSSHTPERLITGVCRQSKMMHVKIAAVSQIDAVLRKANIQDNSIIFLSWH